jgi:hypothetical protein
MHTGILIHGPDDYNYFHVGTCEVTEPNKAPKSFKDKVCLPSAVCCLFYVCCLLFAIYLLSTVCLPSTVYCLPPVCLLSSFFYLWARVRSPSPTRPRRRLRTRSVSCLPSAACSLLSTCCFLPAVCCLLSAVYCLLPAACCQAAFCLPAAVCCLLSGICGHSRVQSKTRRLCHAWRISIRCLPSAVYCLEHLHNTIVALVAINKRRHRNTHKHIHKLTHTYTHTHTHTPRLWVLISARCRTRPTCMKTCHT